MYLSAKFGAPIVRLAFRVDDRFITQGRERFGERVVVVVQALRAHAGVFVERVVLLNPFVGGFHARVVLLEAGVDHALEAGVGH